MNKKYNIIISNLIFYLIITLYLIYFIYIIYYLLFPQKEGFMNKFRRRMRRAARKAKEAARKAAKKAKEAARKAAEKAAEEARKAAEKAAEEARKAAEEALKIDKALGNLFNGVLRLGNTVLNISNKLKIK